MGTLQQILSALTTLVIALSSQISALPPNTQLAAVAPTSGLVGYWNFDEGSGITATDSSGNGNTGIISGATWTTGKVGSGALSFDGNNNYVLKNSFSGDFTNGGTVSFWTYNNSLTSNDGFVVSSQIVPLIYISVGKIRASVYNTDSGSAFDTQLGSSDIPLNQWVFYTVIWDSSALKIYKNGVLDVEDTTIIGTFKSAPGNMYIGNDRNNAGRAIDGKMDEVRVYNRALSSQEILDIYNDMGGAPPPPPTPVNGSCGTTLNICTSGTLSDVADTSTDYLWSCQGSNGGTNVSCSLPIPSADTQAPTVPTNLTATAVSSSQINLSWTASTDNVGVAGYDIYRNGILLTSTATNNYADTGLSPSTLYSYAVRAKDVTANVSVQSDSVSATTQGAVSDNCSQVNVRCVPQEYVTIQACANVAVAGDTCLVSSGTYNERVNLLTSGTAGNLITFKGNPVRLAVMQGFYVNANYIRIEGFDISTTAQGWNGGGVWLAGHNVQIVDNYFHDIPYAAVASSWTGPYWDNTYIANNHIYKTNQGILLKAANSTVENNDIERMIRSGGWDADYMRFWGTNNVIRKNYLHGTLLSEIGSSHSDCFQTFNNNGEIIMDIIVEQNWCQDAHQGFLGGGSVTDPARNMTFRNNVFKDLWSWAAVTNSEAVGTKFYNNTIVNMSIHGTGITAPGDLEVKNNIFYNGGSNYWGNSGTLSGGYNIITTPSHPRYSESTDLVNVDPMFVNVSNPLGADSKPFTADDGLHLSNNSPAINTGFNLSSYFVNDIFGISRPQGSAWDIGAYEYQSGGSPLPPPSGGGYDSGSTSGGNTNNGGSAGNSSGNTSSTENNTNPTTCIGSTISSQAKLTRNLYKTVKGDDVKTLQNFLISQKLLSSDSNTGFFGPLTEKAVQSFQKSQNIVSSGSPLSTGYGNVGPTTRAKINSMLDQQSLGGVGCPSTTSTTSTTSSLQEQIKALQAQVDALLVKLQQAR